MSMRFKGVTETLRGRGIPSNLPVATNKVFNTTLTSLGDPAGLVLSAPTVNTEYPNILSDRPSITGGVDFQLHPLDYISTPATTNVVFTVPIPFGVATNINQVRILNSGGGQLASTVSVISKWREPASQSVPKQAYIKSVLVKMNVTFPDTNPLSLKVDFSTKRTAEANLSFDISSIRSTINTSSFFPSEYAAGENIWEPNAVATFSPEWLCACVFKTRPRPFNSADAQWVGLEGPYQNAGYTYPTNGGGTYAGDSESLSKVEWFMKSMVNDVRPHVETEDLITYEGVGNYAPWLYDRAGTLWLAYFRTGKLEWWRHAHRASQFYKNHIGLTGYFDLRADDVKYSYGRSMLHDYLMTGDTTLVDKIEDITLPTIVDSGNYTAAYTYVEFTGANSIPGWTERHASYALLAQIDAYEATGTTSYLTRAQTIFNAVFDLQQNPANYNVAWTKDGGVPHTIMAHEGGTGGGTGNEPITSPWMCSLLCDSVLRYYIVTEDPNALTFLADLGDYYANVALRTAVSGELTGSTVPWYLAGNNNGLFTYTDSGELGDMEHVPDVLGAMAKCMWAKWAKGESLTALQTAFTNLYGTTTGPDWASFDQNGVTGYWIRDAQATIDNGQTIFRLAPPRKGSWWYNSASDLTYLEEVVNG